MDRLIISGAALVALICASGTVLGASPALENYASNFKRSCLAYAQKKNPQYPEAGEELCECLSQKYLSIGDDEARRLLADDKETKYRLDSSFAQSCMQKVASTATQERSATEQFEHVPSPLPDLLETKSGVYLDESMNKKITQVIEDTDIRTIIALKTGGACLIITYPLKFMGRLDTSNETKLTMLLRMASEDPDVTIGAQQISKVKNMPARLFEATAKNETLGKVEKTNFYGAYIIDETNDAGMVAFCWNKKGTKASVKKESQGLISGIVGSARRY